MKIFSNNIKSKIIDSWELSSICQQYRKTDQKIVFSNGCFDILHTGHIHTLTTASQKADILIVGINSDLSVSKLKGPTRPINCQEDRAFLLASLIMIDWVCIFTEETPLNLIKTIKPDILVKGGDYNIKEIVGYDFITSYGGQVIISPFIDSYSTTSIINKKK